MAKYPGYSPVFPCKEPREALHRSSPGQRLLRSNPRIDNVTTPFSLLNQPSPHAFFTFLHLLWPSGPQWITCSLFLWLELPFQVRAALCFMRLGVVCFCSQGRTLFQCICTSIFGIQVYNCCPFAWRPVRGVFPHQFSFVARIACRPLPPLPAFNS